MPFSFITPFFSTFRAFTALLKRRFQSVPALYGHRRAWLSQGCGTVRAGQVAAVGGGPDSPGCWQSFPWQCQGLSAAPRAQFRVTGELCLLPRKSFRQNGCHGSQKAVWKPKISDPNLSLPQHLPSKGQSSSF